MEISAVRGRRGLVVKASDCGEGGPQFDSRSRRLFSTNKRNEIRDLFQHAVNNQ